MITITLGKKEYDVPTEMSVEQYQKIQTQRLFLDNSDPSKLLAAYLDIDVKEIKNANKEQVKFLEAFVFERLTKNVSKDVIFTFDYEGVTYGFQKLTTLTPLTIELSYSRRYQSRFGLEQHNFFFSSAKHT